jgi:ferrous iron transport protein A
MTHDPGLILLSDLGVGQRARVLGIDAGDEIGQRILEMGLIPGVEVELVGTAPWGDPLEVVLRGYHLSLRRAEAARVEVQRL